MKNKINWAIVSTGNIARAFAKDLQLLDNANLLAVSSRSQSSVDKFADEFNVQKRYEGLEPLLNDADIDIVYVANPHPWHKGTTLACLKNKKPVLCEKPFAMNSKESAEMILTASENNVFLMEAMWMYCFEAAAKIKELVCSGQIGRIKMVEANFGFKAAYDPAGRAFNKTLGGGALLDVGVYTIAFAQMVYGKTPERVKAISHIGKTDVDEQTSMVFKYDDGAMAKLACSFISKFNNSAWIYGDKGSICVPENFHRPGKITLNKNDQSEGISFDIKGTGLCYEAAEAMKCLGAGKLESDIIPHKTSQSIMETIDRCFKNVAG